MLRKNLTLLLLTYSAALCSGEDAAPPVDTHTEPVAAENAVAAEPKSTEVVPEVEPTPEIETPTKPYIYTEADIRTLFEESGLVVEEIEKSETDEDTYTCKASIKYARTSVGRQATFFCILQFSEYVGPRLTVFLEMYRGNPEQDDEDFLKKTNDVGIKNLYLLKLITKTLESESESFPQAPVVFTAMNIFPTNKESAREVLFSFMCLLSRDIDDLLLERDGVMPVFISGEQVGENLLLSFENRFAYELQRRAHRGWKKGDYVMGKPIADDPLSYPMQMIAFQDILKATLAGCNESAADMLQKDPLSHLVSRRALDIYLRCQSREPSVQELGVLEGFALDPTTQEIRDPVAHYMLTRFTYDKDETFDDDEAEFYIKWAKDIRRSAVLGFPQGLQLYVNILESIDEDEYEPGSADLLESKEWQALAPVFLDKFMGVTRANLDERYRNNDLTPFELEGPKDPKIYLLAQGALDKMNAARKARGWITFTFEKPAAEAETVKDETAEVAVK